MNLRDKDTETGTQYIQASESQNIIGRAFGKKITSGKITGDIACKFFVTKKKPVSELEADEIIPEHIVINNVTYPTDVVEIKKVSALGCNDWFPGQTSPTQEQLAHRAKVRPVVGGISTVNYDDMSETAGTLGILAKDMSDNSVVGLTNAHVVCEYQSVNSEKTKVSITYNTYNKTVVQPAPIDTAFSPDHRIGTVKRYFPIKDESTIDAALINIDNGITLANGQFNMFSGNLPWATDQEINSIISSNIQLSKSSRTTGSIGSIPGCPIIATDLDVAIMVGGYDKNTQTFIFANCIMISYSDLSAGVAVGGDSGSAVIGNFNGTQKIVGLLFAGGTTEENPDQENNFGVVCRITEIARKLKISEINLTTETIRYGSPENWTYKASSNTNSEEIVSFDSYGKTYWSIGNAYLN